MKLRKLNERLQWLKESVSVEELRKLAEQQFDNDFANFEANFVREFASANPEFDMDWVKADSSPSYEKVREKFCDAYIQNMFFDANSNDLRTESIDPEIAKNWVKHDVKGTVVSTNRNNDSLIMHDDRGLNADVFNWSVVDSDGSVLLDTGRLYYGYVVCYMAPTETSHGTKQYADAVILKCIVDYYGFDDNDVLSFLDSGLRRRYQSTCGINPHDEYYKRWNDITYVRDILNQAKAENYIRRFIKNPSMKESFDDYGEPKRCEQCGTLLNDMGGCPYCDYGDEEALEDSLNESMSPRDVDKYIWDKIKDDAKLSADNSRYYDFSRSIHEGDCAKLTTLSNLPKDADYKFSLINDTVDIDLYLGIESDGDCWYVVDHSAASIEEKCCSKKMQEAHNYGGAYDVDPEMYFTKEDLVEFSDSVIEYIASACDCLFDLEDIQISPDNTITITLNNHARNGDFSYTYSFKVDMRSIRKPSDLDKYTVSVGNAFINEYDERCLNESGYIPGLTDCPVCGGTRFNANKGFCLDCGYDEVDPEEDNFTDDELARIYGGDTQRDNLSESVLNEGPLKDLVRRGVRGVQNAVDPGGAKKRAEVDYGKDEKERRKKALVVLSKDFDKRNARSKFYLNHDYTKPYEYSDWHDMFAGELDDDKFAQWNNAIVVDEDGYYVRRGAENLKSRYVKFYPGKNDELAKIYRMEPYSYNPKWKNKPEDKPSTEEKPTEEKPVKGTTETETKPGKKDAPTKKDPKASDPKSAAPKARAPKDLTKFRNLCKLTGLTIVDADGNVVPTSKLGMITRDTFDQYKVVRGKSKPIPLADWYAVAQKSNFLESYSKLKNSLNESFLNEAPVISLSDDDIMNPDKIDFKKIAADATKKEKEAQEKEKQAPKIAELQSVANEVFSEIQGMNPRAALEFLHDKIVPDSGKAESVAGEIVRALMRLLYRSYNDGDRFYMGYGLETCGSSAQYLADMGYANEIQHAIDSYYRNDSDNAYDAELDEITNRVMDDLMHDISLYTQINDVDSLNVDYSMIEDEQPTFDFDFYASDDIIELVEAGVLSNSDLRSYVESCLEYVTEVRNYEIEIPWGSDSTVVTVTNLTADGKEYCEDMMRDEDRFWADLVDEYSEELENIRSEYDDDFDNEEEKED